ncbi:MAG: hypothetical protein WCG98_08735 [bacterium]
MEFPVSGETTISPDWVQVILVHDRFSPDHRRIASQEDVTSGAISSSVSTHVNSCPIAGNKELSGDDS